MDSPNSTIYIQKIEEYIYDNNDIITSTVLSDKLNIKVKDARMLMQQFVKDTRRCNADELAITYLLIGTNQDGNISMEVVKETDLQKKRDQLKVVNFEYIYSIQKSKDVELNTLAVLEPISAIHTREKPLLGSIVSPNAVKRKLKTKEIEIKPAVKKQKEQKAIKPDPNVNINKNSTKNGSLSSFLSKESNKPACKPAISTKKTPKSLMANFLSSGPNKLPKTPKTEKIVENDIEMKEQEPDIISVKVKENTVEDVETKIEKVSKHKQIASDSDENTPPAKKTKQTPKQKTKKRKSVKEKGDQATKRRRIITQDDSDSDDIFASDNEKEIEDEDVVISDQEAPPPKQLPPSKRKVRKAVSELTKDSDGYFETVNKFVYESASGEEEEGEVEKQKESKNGILKSEENKEQKPNNSIQPKTQNDNTKKKNASPLKTTKNNKGKAQKLAQNQTSIMSFFKK